jgi:hypothetical protein
VTCSVQFPLPTHPLSPHPLSPTFDDSNNDTQPYTETPEKTHTLSCMMVKLHKTIRSVNQKASSSPPSPFSASDLKSGNGFLTGVWGPSLWMTLHTISMNYPCNPTPLQKKQYKTFFDSLQHVLPCGKCRDNLVSNLRTTKYSSKVFENRETLSKWVYQLHACVNEMLGKSTPISYREMRHTFENFRARCNLQPNATSSTKRKRTQNGGGRQTASDTRLRQGVREGGCTIPLTGIKSRCVLRIVPAGGSTKTFAVNRRCLCRRMNHNHQSARSAAVRSGTVKKCCTKR